MHKSLSQKQAIIKPGKKTKPVLKQILYKKTVLFLILTDKVYGVIIFESKLKKKRGRNKTNCFRCGESVPDDAIFCS